MTNFKWKRLKFELKHEFKWLVAPGLVELNVHVCSELNFNKIECVEHK